MSNNFYSDEEESKIKNDGSFNALLSTAPLYPFALPPSQMPSNMSVEPDFGLPPENKDVDLAKLIDSIGPIKPTTPIAKPAMAGATPVSKKPLSAKSSFDFSKPLDDMKPLDLPVAGPSLPPTDANQPKPKRSIVDEYSDLAKSQDEAIKGAQDSADTGNMIANILKGLSGVANADTISRGGRGYDVSNFDKIVDANNARVKNAQAGKAAALEELLKKNNLGRQIVEDERAGKRFDREQVENKYRDINFSNSLEDRTTNNSRASARFNQELKDNGFKNSINQASAESIDPNSAISKQAVLTGKAVLISKAKEAASAGDKQASELLLNQANQLEGLSAAKVNDLINMNKSLDYKDVLNRNHQDAMSAAAEKKQAQKDEKLKQQYTVGVRKEITGLPAYKDLQALDRQFSSMSEVFKNPNSVSDEAFIVNFQKMLDPGSVVREGEFSRTREGSGLVAKLEMAIQQARGNGRVSPEVRKSILETSKAIADGAHKYFENTALAPYKEYMKAYDIPVEQVINTNAREYGESVTTPNQSSGVQIKSVKDLPPI